MNPTLLSLIELQHIDDEIRGHRKQRDELASNLVRLRSILAQMDKDLADKRGRLAEATSFYDDKKIDLAADTERLGHAKQKLLAVSRTKEYAAMQKELDTLRKKSSDDEAELERLAAAIQEYRASVQAQEAKLAEIQAEVAREEATSGERLGDLEKIIGGIASKKIVIVQTMPKDVVSRYEKVIEKRDGVAVVLAAQGRCSGCRMQLPPQQWVKVQMGKELHHCASCLRYLYYTPQAAAAAVN